MTHSDLTYPTCPSCGCTQPSGLLCSEDTAAFETMLAAVPALVIEMDTAISKQAHLSNASKMGKGTAREKNPINWGVVAVRDALLVEVALWGDDIDAVRRHPQAAEIVSSFGRAVANAYRAIDRAQDRQYLGTCLYTEDGAVCHGELWAAQGAHQVKCTQCETVHNIPDRRRLLLEQAAPMVVTAKEAARYVSEVGDMPIGEANIRNWVGRGKVPLRPGLSGQRQFELGELLAYVAKREAEAAEQVAA